MEITPPWPSGVVLGSKKDGKLSMCIDYWQLNQQTIKNSYALPRIEEIRPIVRIHLLHGVWYEEWISSSGNIWGTQGNGSLYCWATRVLRVQWDAIDALPTPLPPTWWSSTWVNYTWSTVSSTSRMSSFSPPPWTPWEVREDSVDITSGWYQAVIEEMLIDASSIWLYQYHRWK